MKGDRVVLPRDAPDAIRGAIWERPSHQHAEALLTEIGDVARTIGQRIARARCWIALEVYEPAWNELSEIERRLPPGRLRARVRADLVILSYYLARDIDDAMQSAIEGEAESDPAVFADLHLGLALRATGRNELHEALKHLYLGLDVAKLAQKQRPRDVLALLRVQAHVLAQAACYRDALLAADLALSTSRAIGDDWEVGRRSIRGALCSCVRDAPAKRSRSSTVLSR